MTPSSFRVVALLCSMLLPLQSWYNVTIPLRVYSFDTVISSTDLTIADVRKRTALEWNRYVIPAEQA